MCLPASRSRIEVDSPTSNHTKTKQNKTKTLHLWIVVHFRCSQVDNQNSHHTASLSLFPPSPSLDLILRTSIRLNCQWRRIEPASISNGSQQVTQLVPLASHVWPTSLPLQSLTRHQFLVAWMEWTCVTMSWQWLRGGEDGRMDSCRGGSSCIG